MKNTNELENLIDTAIRKHGIVSVIRAIVSVSDGAADFANMCNDKNLEARYRVVATSMLDAINKMDSFPEKSRKY